MDGADAASVALSFGLPKGHPAFTMLAENGIGSDGEIIIRRTLSRDGRSRAFVNDAPVGIALLKSVGDMLIEIHGQFEGLSLLNPATHMDILDAYGGHGAKRERTRSAFSAWQEKKSEREKTEAEFEKAKADEDYMRHNLDELEDLNPKPGEEAELDERRHALMAEGRTAAAMEDAYATLSKYGSEPARFVRDAKYALERVPFESLGETARTILDSLETAHLALDDAHEKLGDALAAAPGTLGVDKVEERLFKIRELARKHRIMPDELPGFMQNLKSLVEAIDNSDAVLAQKRKLEDEAKAAYMDAARELSSARKSSAAKLGAKAMAELPPLKLEKATFEVVVEPRAEKDYGPAGMDSVCFMGATNAGGRRGYIHKIASGGELARFTLAIKVVLSDANSVPSMVFDEVDTGISGATAAAVGERLAKLGASVQTLVITHSPQVAACGNHHFRVSKSYDDERGRTVTSVDHLTEQQRVQEIARIISGDRITDEALRAAGKLLETSRRA
jgi:DNA repair protein RecN (Recombination protein N)